MRVPRSPSSRPPVRYAVAATLAFVVVALAFVVGQAGATVPETATDPAGLGERVERALTERSDGPGRTDGADRTLVVDDDGEGYDSIGAALEAAGAGDRVLVRPGTYRESVIVDESVRLVAPDGATLLGRGVDAAAGVVVPAEGAVEPTVDGLRIRGFQTGVDASGTGGDWTLRNLTITESVYAGVDAARTTGDWTLSNVTVRDTVADGVYAPGASGDWSIRASEVRDSGFDGVDAHGTDGDWSIRGAVVADSGFTGVDAADAGGAWSVRASTLGDGGFASVLADDATGAWTVHLSSVSGDVDATGATGGTATHNWWGRTGAVRCTGNVDCSEPLSSPPVRGVSVAQRLDGTVVSPNGTVTATVRVSTLVERRRLAIETSVDPGVADFTVVDVSVSGEGSVVAAGASPTSTTVALGGLSAGATVVVTYRLTVPAGTNGTEYVLSGRVAAADGSVGLGPRTFSVADPVERADLDGDGEVDTGELNAAIADWTRGRYTTEALNRILTAWVEDG